LGTIFGLDLDVVDPLLDAPFEEALGESGGSFCITAQALVSMGGGASCFLVDRGGVEGGGWGTILVEAEAMVEFFLMERRVFFF
jgi:hypothetical protein